MDAMDAKDPTLLYTGHIVKTRGSMFKLYNREIDAIALQGNPNRMLTRRLVIHGGKRARKFGRWSYVNIVARLKHRVLGPFRSATDVWRASRSLKRPFQLGMGLMELRARMRFNRGAPWFVYRIRHPKKITCGELMWVGLDGDDKTAGKGFLDSAGGARFYVPGSPSQPSWKKLSTESPRYGVSPARWKAMHAVRGAPVPRPLPDIPKVAEKVQARKARESFRREVCPVDDDERIDLTHPDSAVDFRAVMGALEPLDSLAGSLWDWMGPPGAVVDEILGGCLNTQMGVLSPDEDMDESV